MYLMYVDESGDIGLAGLPTCGYRYLQISTIIDDPNHRDSGNNATSINITFDVLALYRLLHKPLAPKR